MCKSKPYENQDLLNAIEKFLKHRYQKWAHILHLELGVENYG